MKQTYHIVLALLLLCPIFTLSAQDTYRNPDEYSTDVMLKTGVGVEYELYPSLNLGIEEELYLKDNLSFVDRVNSNIELSYRINPYVRVGVLYTLIAKHNKGKASSDFENYWTVRHRANVMITGNYRIGRIKMALRERLMMTYRTDSLNPREKANPELILRSRLRFAYDIYKSPFEPYVFCELYNTLNAPVLVGNYINRVRAQVGLNYNITPRNAVSLYYNFDYSLNKDINIGKKSGDITFTDKYSNNHIIGLYYTYKIN